MEDTVALFVGRVIMAYGLLDQATWDTVSDLERYSVRYKRKVEGVHVDPVDIQEGFELRLQRIRKLLTIYSEKERVIQFDKLRRKIDLLFQIRSRLAHGAVSWYDNRVSVRDRSETNRYLRNRERAMKLFSRMMSKGINNWPHLKEKIEGAMFKLGDEHFAISYSLDDLTDAAIQLQASAEEMRRIGFHFALIRFPPSADNRGGANG